MLTLHLEAATHSELVHLAMNTLGVPTTAPATLTPPVATEEVRLPEPAPRTPRVKKTTPPAPVQPALSTEAPAAAATASAPQAPAPAVAAPVASASSTVPAAPTAPAVPSIDDVRYALGEVLGKHGEPACTQLLKDHGAVQEGVVRVSFVPEARRAELIKACKAKVAQDK